MGCSNLCPLFFHLSGQINSTNPLPLTLLVPLLLFSVSDLTDSLRPREYLSNVKLSGLVVDVASVASLLLSQVRRPLKGGGTILQLCSTPTGRLCKRSADKNTMHLLWSSFNIPKLRKLSEDLCRELENCGIYIDSLTQQSW